jgi:hypothetical protein
VILGLVGPIIESESIRVFPAVAKESDSLFYDFSRIVPTLSVPVTVRVAGKAKKTPQRWQEEQGGGEQKKNREGFPLNSVISPETITKKVFFTLTC